MDTAKPPGCVELRVRVTPRAGRSQLALGEDGILSAHVTAPPAEGQANRAVIELLAKQLGVPKSSVSIVAGSRSRDKRVRIDGLTASEVHDRLS